MPRKPASRKSEATLPRDSAEPTVESHGDFTVETIPIAELRPHPRNYRTHPDDQIAHLIESIREHGFYRNIVIARDGTILAGHGVVQAASKMGFTSIPIARLDLAPDEPRALKVLAADNEIGHLIEIDDRALSELLKEVKDFDVDGLLGTGYDEMMLANLVMVTRAENEIADFDEAAAWAGLPGYQGGDGRTAITVAFRNTDDRASFLSMLHIDIGEKTQTIWWPPKPNEDLSSVRFVG